MSRCTFACTMYIGAVIMWCFTKLKLMIREKSCKVIYIAININSVVVKCINIYFLVMDVVHSTAQNILI